MEHNNSSGYIWSGMIVGFFIIFVLIVLIFMNTIRAYVQNDAQLGNSENVEKNFKMINDIKSTLVNLDDELSLVKNDEVADITKQIKLLEEKDTQFEEIHINWENQFNDLMDSHKEELSGLRQNILRSNFVNISEENSENIDGLVEKIRSTENDLDWLRQSLETIQY